MKAEDRLHALDAVRAFALLSGVVLHAAMSFLPGLISLGWPIADRSPSMALQWLFYTIHVFRMTLFFVVAGFFAHLMFHRKGAVGFVRDRAKRIALPMVIGWAVMFPLITLVMIWASMKPHIAVPSAPPPSGAVQAGFQLTHLWFLYYLLLIYAISLIARWWWVNKLDRGGRLRTYIDSTLAWTMRWGIAPLFLALPIGVCLYFTPHWALWTGVVTPDRGFTPQLPALIAYEVAFGFGWLLHRRIELLKVFEKRWPMHLAFALIATVASGSLLASPSMVYSVEPGSAKLIYAATYTFATWNWVFALIGLALRFFSAPSAVRRYLADASYWIYLAHLPLVFALQTAMMQWNLHWSIKFPAIVLVATALLLISYRYLVRYTYIGEVLNGRKHVRGAVAPSATQIVRDTAIVAELSGVRKRYGSTLAMDGIDLQIRAGEVFAILGPNGAGKSTSVSMLLGLQDPDEGVARVFGESPHLLQTRQKFGAMLQEVTLAPELRVRELIDLTSSYYPNAMPVDEVLRLTNTLSLAKRPYGKLSGGQQRLVQFAMAVCGRPQLLFLDEPTVGLDIEARQTLWATLRQLVAGGCSVVLTTHYLEEAEALADRVAVLAKGKIVMVGSVDEVRARVACKRISCITALDIGWVSLWPGVIDVTREGERLRFTVSDADDMTRRLIREDPGFKELEISRAGLAEAFAALTQETA